MNQTETTKPSEIPSAPPYLSELAALLKEKLPDAWHWAASSEFADQDVEAIRLDLLRSSIRLDRESNDVYQAVDVVAKRLGLAIPLTIYQQQNPVGWNAAAVPLIDEAHLLIAGPLLDELSGDELTSVLAHELGHVLLWQIDEGKYRVLMRLLDGLVSDPAATVAHVESARLARLYTEIYCDRVSMTIVDDPNAVVAALIKIGTQSNQVDVTSYLKQTEEILSLTGASSEGDTHPELYIRARAIQLLRDGGDGDDGGQTDVDNEITKMIQGESNLDQLDLLTQSDLTALTRNVLDALFRHKWFRTTAALAHARLFFDDYKPSKMSKPRLKELSKQIIRADKSIKQYVVYLLLDFATTDRESEDMPLALTLDLAEKFSLADIYHESVRKELRMRVKQLRDLVKNKEAMLAQAEAT